MAMQIPVLIEPIAGNGYLAKTGEPLPLCAEGATRAEAVQKLEELIGHRLQNGTELFTLEVSERANAWRDMAGIYDPADPEVQAWIQAMVEYRQKIENDPDYL